MSKEKMEWIIASHNSDEDEIRLMKMSTTKEKIKEQLLSLIKSDQEVMRSKFECFDYGTESVDDIEEYTDDVTGELIGLHAYACYQNCHIEYNAIVSNMIEVLKEEKNYE